MQGDQGTVAGGAKGIAVMRSDRDDPEQVERRQGRATLTTSRPRPGNEDARIMPPGLRACREQGVEAGKVSRILASNGGTEHEMKRFAATNRARPVDRAIGRRGTLRARATVSRSAKRVASGSGVSAVPASRARERS